MDLEVKQIKDLINEIYFNKNHDLDLQKKIIIFTVMLYR